MLSQTQALENALTLYRQKAKFGTIAQQLAKAGYRSDRTKAPLSAQGVRAMIVQELRKRGEMEREGTQRRQRLTPSKESGIIEVSGKKAELIEMVKEIANSNLSAMLKLKTIETLLS